MLHLICKSGRKARVYLALGVCVSLLVGFSSAAVAYLLGLLVGDLSRLWFYLVLFIAAVLVRVLCTYGQGVLFSYCAAEVQHHLRESIGGALARMHMHSIDRIRTGDMLTRVGSDLQKVYEPIQQTIPYIFQGIAGAVIGLVLLFWIRWELALIIIVGSIVFSFISAEIGKPLQKAHISWRTTQSEVGVRANDIAFGQMDIKAMGMEDAVMAHYKEAVDDWVEKFNRRNGIRGWQRGSHFINSVVVFTCVPLVSSMYIINGEMSVGMVLTAMQVASIVSGTIISFDWWRQDIREAKISLNRIDELLIMDKEREGGNNFQLMPNAPLIRMEGVFFSYGDAMVLRNISLTVKGGEHIALVGASGSGKSTVLRLMAGLYEPTQGHLSFGGYDMQEWSLAAMRTHMAYVQQDTYLYPGSLRDNITCGKQLPDLDEIVSRVQLGEWLDRQPDGLDTDVGERGAKLSGGLRQRVSIARAMALHPQLYLFDEPTSALDVAMEAEIVLAMRSATLDATSVTVAHRLASIVDVDCIYAMRDGSIVEKGTHTELMQARGYYYNLYMLQQKEEESIG